MGPLLILFWAIATSIMGLEMFLLNRNSSHSMLHWLQAHHVIKDTFDISPEAGKTLSIWFGFIGFGLMLLTNLYIARKRFKVFHKMGVLRNWLDFHIFCGLMGPTLILFHCNFKVRGLVAISFWSMMVSVSSGVIGRYMYVQSSRLRSEFIKEAELFNARISSYLQSLKVQVAEEDLLRCRTQALVLAGADQMNSNPFTALFSSMVGDLRLAFATVPTPYPMGEPGQILFKGYAQSVRKANTTDSFTKLMGYWHTFHTPFAVFMYLAAVLHIAAEYWLGAV